MGVTRIFVEQNCGTRYGLRVMIKVRNHVQQTAVIVFCRPTETEKRLGDLLTIDSKQFVFCAVSS